jgi:hypothetical protein
VCLVHLVDGNVLLGEQRLDAAQIIAGVCRLSPGSVQRSLRAGDIRLRLSDRGLRAIDVGAGAASGRSGGGDGVHLGPNATLFVPDLAFESSLVRHRASKRVLIGSIIDFEK